MKYTKPALTYNQQLDLLISRGLQVNDRNKALLILSQISYYRLSAYCIPLRYCQMLWPEDLKMYPSSIVQAAF